MRHYKKAEVIQEIQDAIECDVCHEKYYMGHIENESNRDYNKRMVEISEFVHIYHQCGYGSMFGDGKEYKLDICQGCMSRLPGEIIMNRRY